MKPPWRVARILVPVGGSTGDPSGLSGDRRFSVGSLSL